MFVVWGALLVYLVSGAVALVCLLVCSLGLLLAGVFVCCNFLVVFWLGLLWLVLLVACDARGGCCYGYFFCVPSLAVLLCCWLWCGLLRLFGVSC